MSFENQLVPRLRDGKTIIIIQIILMVLPTVLGQQYTTEVVGTIFPGNNCIYTKFF